jgi:hypothetical protein
MLLLYWRGCLFFGGRLWQGADIVAAQRILVVIMGFGCWLFVGV